MILKGYLELINHLEQLPYALLLNFYFMIIKQIVKVAFQGLEIDGDKSIINLGYFDDTETQWLYAYLEDDKIKYRLVDTANNECT